MYIKSKIKSLTVVSLHSAVHLVNPYRLQQGIRETVCEFVAQANNIVSNCGLSNIWSSFDTVNSYLNETVFGVLLAGIILDVSTQQKIHSLAATKTINTLQEVVVTYVTAEERGLNENADIGHGLIQAAWNAPKY